MDAHVILDEMAAGKIFMCGEHATAYVQCCLALGLQARITYLSHHVGTEVYCDRWRKWAVVDGYFGMYYERDGAPLSALELHEAFARRQHDGIRDMEGPLSRAFKVGGLENHLGMYREVRVLMRNDFLTNPDREGRQPLLQWADDRTPPLLFSGNRIVNAWHSNRPEDFSWTLNQVFIDLHVENPYFGKVCQVPVARLGEARLHLLAVRLETEVPHLSRFLVRIDGGGWQESKPDFLWPLHAGPNALAAKVVNVVGVEGPISEVGIVCRPDHTDTVEPDAVNDELTNRLCDAADAASKR